MQLVENEKLLDRITLHGTVALLPDRRNERSMTKSLSLHSYMHFVSFYE